MKVLRSEPRKMARHIALPDNEQQFFVFINMVINNRNGEVKFSGRRPTHVGPHSVTYERNEVGENFMVVDGYKGQQFIEMILDQFYNLRTYWNDIQEAEEYSKASKYQPKY